MITETVESPDRTEKATIALDTAGVSCRVIYSLLKYLEIEGYKIDALIEDLPLSRAYLCNPLNWVSYSIRDKLQERAVAVTGNERIMYEVGLATPRLNSTIGVEHMVKLLENPGLAYNSVPKYSHLFDRNITYQTNIVDDCKAIVTMTVADGYPLSKHLCYYTQGILAAIPTIWDLPPAEIYETECRCEVDAGDTGGVRRHSFDRCVYEITWLSTKRSVTGFWKRLFMRRNGSTFHANELERNFELLDQQNHELQQRHMQMSKVKELALAIDTIRSREEMYKAVVELSRDLDSVRFVTMVKTHDENKDYMVLPYFSKTRNKAIDAALKAAGFDVDELFGEQPGAQKFRYLISQSSFQKKYMKRPMTTTFTSIADLLDGIFPRVLCDYVQKTAGIKMAVIVPVMVDGELWGSIVFFLSDIISTDVFETIGAHCAAALKNITRIEALEQHNQELTVLNVISKTAATSLNSEDMLFNVIRETVKIFNAKSGSIYLFDDKEQTLKLHASFGIPEDIRKSIESISLNDSVSGKFFTSSRDLFSGDFAHYKNEYPIYISQLPEEFNVPFAMAVLKINEVRVGLMTIARDNKDIFIPNEWLLLQSIANQISVALENARLHNDLIMRMSEVEQANAKLTQALKSQAESEMKYRLITENSADYISIITFNGVYTYASPAHRKLGYSEEYLVGKSGFDFVHPEDKKRLFSLMVTYAGMKVSKLLGLKTQNYSESIQFRVTDSEGNWHDLEANASLVESPDNSGLNILLVSRDVTERTKTESAMKEQSELIDATLNSTTNMELVINLKNEVVLVNNAFCSMFDMKKEEVTGKSIDMLLPVPHILDAISKVISKKEQSASAEFKYQLGAAEKILHAKITPMRRGGALLIISDITEELERQQKFYLTDRLASVGEMASGVAHELNNPLTSITLLSQMLVKDTMTEEERDDLATINSEARRAADIVKSLLTFARRHAPERRLAQINLVLEDVLKLRAYMHRTNKITVDARLDQNLIEIPIDYHQMQQVFLNLIVNAEQAMIDSKGRGTLTITTERVNGSVKVTVTDDGPGISDENMKKLFAPFFTTKEVGKGTGLGLSICYGIVNSHGGKIYAESKPEKGTTFIVELPVNEH